MGDLGGNERKAPPGKGGATARLWRGRLGSELCGSLDRLNALARERFPQGGAAVASSPKPGRCGMINGCAAAAFGSRVPIVWTAAESRERSSRLLFVCGP